MQHAGRDGVQQYSGMLSSTHGSFKIASFFTKAPSKCHFLFGICANLRIGCSFCPAVKVEASLLANKSVVLPALTRRYYRSQSECTKKGLKGITLVAEQRIYPVVNTTAHALAAIYDEFE